ncbi:MAG TPA: metallophosphoesterase family protein [Candidatus Saccharimonadales bacterium]|nr:metallophosphoesterase family protein [Candidatus Saccharimonadales bacterium]
MKVLIISDIHGNWPALRAVLEAEPDVTQIICLGDLVNYGPHPVECVSWAKEASPIGIFLQGNHDRALGMDTDPHCSSSYVALAAATQRVTEELLGHELKEFLASLNPSVHFRNGQDTCFACHATPKDPLYHYMPPNSAVSLWESEIIVAQHPDYLFFGHTHLPLKNRFRRTLIINPGSVGQPKDGDPRAAYAIWENGEITLRRTPYEIEETIRAYESFGLESHIRDSLCEVLRTGGNLPAEHYQKPTTQITHG